MATRPERRPTTPKLTEFMRLPAPLGALLWDGVPFDAVVVGTPLPVEEETGRVDVTTAEVAEGVKVAVPSSTV